MNKYIAAIFLLLSLSVHAENIETVGGGLDEFQRKFEIDCAEGGALAKQSKILKLYCPCIPERTRKLRNSLSALEKEAPMTVEMSKRFFSEVINTCSAIQGRALFGQECAERFPKEKPTKDLVAQMVKL